MLKSLNVEGLFGVKGNNKQIDFSSDLTLLVGSNGSGKTTIWNILTHLVQRRFGRLREVPFTKVTLNMTSGTILAYQVGPRLVVCYHDAEERIANDLKVSGTELVPDLQKQIKRFLALQNVESRLPMKIQEFVGRYFVSVGDTDDEPDSVYEHFVMADTSLYFPTYRRFEMDLREIFRQALGVEETYALHMISRNVWRERSQGGVVIGVSNEDIDRIVKQSRTLINQKVQERLRRLINDYTLSLFDVTSENRSEPLGDVQETRIHAH